MSIKDIEVINAQLPQPCRGHAECRECLGCSKVFRTAAALIDSGDGGRFETEHAVRLCFDHIAHHDACDLVSSARASFLKDGTCEAEPRAAVLAAA